MKKLLVLAVAMMVTFALALPATAQDKADWEFYGSVRMSTAPARFEIARQMLS